MGVWTAGARRGPAAAVVLALALAAPAAAQTGEAGEAAAAGEERRALVEAQELVQSGYYRQAVERLTAPARALSPAGDALLGRALALDRRYLAAEAPLRRAVDAGWRDAPTLFYLGSTLWENGRLAEAAEVLAAALEASGGHPAILHQLGRLELWRGRWEESVALLDRALAAAPGEFEPALDRARALAGAGRSADALAAFRALARRAPEHSGVRYGLARLLLATGAAEEGRRELEAYRRLHAEEQAATRASGRRQADLDRGLALLHRGDTLAAVEHLSALEPTPDNLDALARALDAAGRHRESIEALERAVALAPERRDLRDRLTEGRLAGAPADG